ncbi:hypothetical protein TWF106_009748 [Orbilia oligospora]|uniref:LRAT domain-containing protein n=1 Tax=Orbilia oligospora TaxID=2813651 RepID=A0A6G1MQ48_ORBOL|nr:hypothetical protein TWF191_003416 [Orbilia oligospora]KAF3212635.1 hypothetical protein TWF106_009748 [Orbilia oligospora]KAF3265644.1 hypothetical protein TWF192_000288 [Orbilia oligospora]
MEYAIPTGLPISFQCIKDYWNAEQIEEIWELSRPLQFDPLGSIYKTIRWFSGGVPRVSHHAVLVRLKNGAFHIIERGKECIEGSTLVVVSISGSGATIDGVKWGTISKGRPVKDGPTIKQLIKLRDEYINVNSYHWMKENCQKFAIKATLGVLDYEKENLIRKAFRWRVVKLAFAGFLAILLARWWQLRSRASYNREYSDSREERDLEVGIIDGVPVEEAAFPRDLNQIEGTEAEVEALEGPSKLELKLFFFYLALQLAAASALGLLEENNGLTADAKPGSRYLGLDQPSATARLLNIIAVPAMDPSLRSQKGFRYSLSKRSGEVIRNQYLHAVEYVNSDQRPDFAVQAAQGDRYAKIYASLGLVLVEANRQRDFLLDPGLNLERLIITKYLNPVYSKYAHQIYELCCLNNPWLCPEPKNDTRGNSSDEEYGETLERQWRYFLRLDHPPFTVTYTTRLPVLTAVNINIVALGGDTQKISVCRNTAHPVTRYKYIYLTETLSITTTKTAFRDRF